MQLQPPPLTPEQIAGMHIAQYADLAQPAAVKVFGIMHVLLGVYGVGTTILGFINLFVGNLFLMFAPKTPEFTAQMEMQTRMQAKMMNATLVLLIISIVITTLILIAGIQLLKKRRSGLIWSNQYAWTSLAGKVVALFVTIIYTFPIMRETMMQDTIPASVEPILNNLMMVSAIIGVLVTCVYPVVSLILLNRPKTKEWFANRP